MPKQSPGIHLGLYFDRIGWEETEIIKKLGQVWFITFVRDEEFKGSYYTFTFAKPTEALTEKFYLEREVLVVLSSYPSFEPRALDFVDKKIFQFQNSEVNP